MKVSILVVTVVKIVNRIREVGFFDPFDHVGGFAFLPGGAQGVAEVKAYDCGGVDRADSDECL